VHLILSLSISFPYLIKFHDFADNGQEGMKHQMRGATQAQQGMTLRITLMSSHDYLICPQNFAPAVSQG
jgi:hypothetical protein